MADQKTTALTELTTPDPNDIGYIVDDPSGTPTSKKMLLKWFKGYRSWVGQLSQTGTDAPTVDDEQNDDFAITITPTRTAQGQYVLTASAAVFANGKTFCFSQNVSGAGQAADIRFTQSSTTTIAVEAYDWAGAAVDAWAANLEIRVYP